VKNAILEMGFASYSGYVDRDGLPHGIGEIVLFKPRHPQGGTYIGEFRNGMKTGIGSILYSDIEPYTGQWLRDEMRGYGHRSNSHGHEYRGEFFNSRSHGFGEYVMRECARYFGEHCKGLPHGRGIDFVPGGNAAVDYNHGIVVSKDTSLLIRCM
jgi:hypothetical protein